MQTSNRHRWIGTVIVGLALSLAACGGSDQAGNDTPTTTNDPAPPTSVAEEEEVEEAPTEPDESATPDTRQVEHEFGTSDVPVDPQRIVVVGRRGTLPILLDLGFEPVGALDASFILGQPFHPMITDRTDAIGVEPIGSADRTPNIEQVAALRPDLIIGFSRDFGEGSEELAQIAPIVGIPWNFSDPLANVTTVGAVMGVEDDAAALVADFEAELQAAAESVQSPGTISIAGLFAPDDLRIYRSGNLLGQLIEQLGGEIVPTVEELPLDAEDAEVNSVSIERIDLLSGERLISFVNLGQESVDAYREIEAGALVQALPAFQNDQVLEVDPQLVFGTAGIAGLRVVLAQLVDFIGPS